MKRGIKSAEGKLRKFAKILFVSNARVPHPVSSHLEKIVEKIENNNLK